MSTIVPSDPQEALVRDLGKQPGEIAIEQSINYSNLSVAIPSMDFDTNSVQNKKVLVWGLNGTGGVHQRYGEYKPGEELGINPKFSCQATNFVKKCIVLGFVGLTKTYEREVYLRVYREIVPGAFNLYGSKLVTKPVLPRRQPGATSDVSGAGSIPNSPFAGGFYNVYFIGWQDYAGNKRFALVDWYAITDSGYDLEIYRERVTNLSQRPTNTYDSSASGSTALASNFITSNYNGVIQGGVSGRIPLPKIAGQTETTYYLTDSPTASQMTEQKTTLPAGNTITAKLPQPVFSGADLKLVSESDNTFMPVGNTYPYGGLRLKYSPFYVLRNGSPQQILVSENVYSEINAFLNRLKSVASGSTALQKVNGIELKPGVNYVKPNLTFEEGNETPDNWGTRRRSGDNFLNGKVVDGPTGTADNSIEGFVAGFENRSDYIYVLPGYVRSTNSSNQNLVTVGSELSEQGAATALNDVQACNKGKHAGKFLKSAGFTEAGVIAYAKGIDTFLENIAMKAAQSDTFNGYFKGYGYPAHVQGGSDVAVKVGFKFSLRGYANLPSVSGFPLSQSAQPSPKQVEDIAAKYLKVINDSKATLSRGGFVGLPALQQAIYYSVRLGLPIQQFRDQTLQTIKEGKIAYLMKVRKLTQAQAEEEWKKDPLYVGLNRIFTTGGASYSGSSGSGGSSGGSGSGGSSGGSYGGGNNKNKNKNKGKNNKGGNANTKQASSKPETIKITVTRGLAGYRTGIRSTGQTSSKPTLIQTYEGLKSSKQIDGSPIRSFVFPFTPNNVNYSGLGINWTEIERTGGYPIVDWTSFQLLKISFNFDIVSMAQENQAGFGLYYSCEDQIQELREMAQAPYPVTFLNMDKFMQDELRWPSLNTGRGIEFVIQEFSVTAVQRTPTNPTALKFNPVANQISRASCTMTLQEIPIEKVDIVQMPPMKPCKKECSKDKITTEKDSYFPLFTPIITRSGG